MLSISLVFLSLLTALGISVYFFLTRHFKYWKKRGVPYLSPTVGVGNMASVFTLKQPIWERLLEMHRMSKDPFTGFFLLDQPALLVRDLNLIKHILVKDFSHFVDREFSPNPHKDTMLAYNLFGLKENDWRQLRTKLTSSFTSSKMKNMFYLVQNNCQKFDEAIAKHIKTNSTIDFAEFSINFTTDVISTCVFGIEGRSFEDPKWEMRKVGRMFTNPDLWASIKFVFMLVAPWVLTTFRLQIHPEDMYETMRKVVWDTVKYREENGINRNDFLDTLMELRKKSLADMKESSDFVLDGDFFMAQALVFLLAGTETSATAISLALYELALNPDIQQKARKEVTDILQKYNGEMTYDGLQEMKYLQNVLNETLRKYPSLGFLERKCTKTYLIPGTDVVIEEGQRLFISTLGIHNDPEYFPEPDDFIPERFSDDSTFSSDENDKFTYLPFGEGPRNCIGKRFGQMQSTAGIAQILSKYKIEMSKKTSHPPHYNERNFTLVIYDMFLKIKPLI